MNQLFSRTAIAEVCAGETNGRAGRAMQDLLASGAAMPSASRGQVISELSSWLATNHRSEYVFKNTLASKLLFGRHKPSTSAFLQEFRVGRSKIDAVLVNGSASAFEIKTALDSPQKLAKQIADYRCVFPTITVVTDESCSDQYEKLLAGTPVGVLVLTRRTGSLSLRKPAEYDASSLSVESMLRSLRKQEYSELVRRATGETPEVPSGLHFAACLDRVANFDAEEVHRLWMARLRERRLRAPQTLSTESLRPLRHICAEINPDEQEARQLNLWLTGRVA